MEFIREKNHCKCLMYDQDMCELDGTSMCTDHCNIFIRLSYMLAYANIPKSMQKRILLDFGFMGDDAYAVIGHTLHHTYDFVNNGKCLYLYGGTGTGKSSIAAKIAINYLIDVAYSTDDIDDQVYFVQVDDFLQFYRRNKDNKADDVDCVINLMKNCKLVILDDICAHKYTAYEMEVLFPILKHRTHNGLSTIYTCNLSTDTNKENDHRIASLMMQNSYPVHVNGPDRRYMSKDDFINSFGGDR